MSTGNCVGSSRKIDWPSDVDLQGRLVECRDCKQEVRAHKGADCAFLESHTAEGWNRLHCCKLDCPMEAEYEVRTMRTNGQMAGPDPYSDFTEACTAHVGDLLGWQPEAEATDEIMWEVRASVGESRKATQ